MATNYFANLQHAIAQNDEHKFFTLVFNNLGREILVRTKGYLGKSKGVIDEKDVLSEVLEKVFKKGMKHFENFDQGHFEGYLYKTAKNLCLNILERNKTLPSISSDVEEHHLSLKSSNNEDFKQDDDSERTFSNLNDIQKTIVTMCMEGYSFQEIRVKLGLKPTNFQYHKKQALERMGIP